jgi:hypothetical protein
MNKEVSYILGLVLMTMLILAKDVIAPLLKKALGKNNNSKSKDCINIDVFYQEFKSFKETQNGFNDRVEIILGKINDLLIERK